MFGRLAHFMYRRRWQVVGAWLVILVLALAAALQVGSVLGPGDFSQPGSDSQKAAAILDQKFHQNDQKDTLVLIANPSMATANPAFQQTVARIAARIQRDRGLRVAYLDNPLVSHNRQLIGKDGHSIVLFLSSNLKEAQIEGQIDHLRAIIRAPGFTTHVLGTPAANHDYAVVAKSDLSISESITVPILLVLLLLVFGTVVAAGLPLLLAGLSIVLSLALVYIFGHFISTSVYVNNVVTLLGLGIGIDYSLFIVYRFREELERTGGNVELSVVRTMQTTGRAVFFSGITVAIGLSSLILTGLSFMVSMGLGGMLVPITALLVTMTLLPAMLGILGTRVNRLDAVALIRRLIRRPRPEGAVAHESALWHGIAMSIMRRPVLVGGAVVIIMLALAFPVTRLQFAFGGLKNAPQNIDSTRGFLYMQQHFTNAPDPIQVVIQQQGAGTLLVPREVLGMRRLEAQLRKDPEAWKVVGVPDFVATSGGINAAQRAQLMGRYLSPDLKSGIITVVPIDVVGTKPTEDLVRRARVDANRAMGAALSGTVIRVGGAQADYTDFNDSMYTRFPEIVVLVLLLSYAFLFFAFRSVFLPFKAVILNLLSVGASYGVLELVFQQGVGSGILRFSAESGVASWVPIFLFAFLFGLSMDYEVFLLSRIREEWLNTGQNALSVATGLERTGRLISSAAAIMIIAFAGFLIGHEIQLKEFGFGLLAAIAVDATLIRILLVPSIMALMGDWNWWVPSFLRDFSLRASPLEGGFPLEDEREPVTV